MFKTSPYGVKVVEEYLSTFGELPEELIAWIERIDWVKGFKMKIGDSGSWDIFTAAELWESESEGEESDGEEVEALTEVSVNALRVKYGLVEAGDEEDP